MREVYAALGTRSFRLAAMGLRALLEEVMNSKLGDIGGFDQKMEAMVKGGLLSEFQKEVLDPTLELGHAAIHRGHQPSGQQIQAALVVVESLLNLMFVQSKAIESIKEGVEPRQRKVKAAIQDKNAPP